MGKITAANSQYILVIPDLFPVPQLLQGYATDAAFDTAASDDAEVVIGVDGIASGGFVPFLTEQTIHLQADSPSVTLFESWMELEKSNREKSIATATIILPSIGRKYALTNGFLRTIVAISGAGKVLKPRDFTIIWGNISPAPV